MNDEDFNVNNTYSIYLPDNYLNYKYLYNVTNDYIELTTEDEIEENHTYNTIRVYNNREGFVVPFTETSFENSTLQEVNVTNDFFSRRDSMPIVCCSFVMAYIIILLFNVITEFFSKGGIFH